MREKLSALVNLQKVDLEISALKKAAEAHPKQVAELEKELAAARSAVEAERSRQTDLERQRAALEHSIAEEKEKVRKWEARLTEQRSPREYAALAREIDIAKKANTTMAEQFAELGKTLTAARELVKEKEREFRAREAEIHEKIAELKKQQSAFDEQARALEEKRASAASNVAPDLMRRYDAVRKKRMPAMVPVVAPGTCQGCNMNVPPQLYSMLRTTLGVDICPSCNRLIHAAEAL